MQNNVNIFVACFTTSYARLKLYNTLDTLKERVLYMDTDSVIYTQKPTESLIPVGNYLGQFTNELDEGDYIRVRCSRTQELCLHNQTRKTMLESQRFYPQRTRTKNPLFQQHERSSPQRNSTS